MSFQGNSFQRNQNFVRDRDLGQPESTIAAEKVDDEFDNVGAGLTTVMTAVDTLGKRLTDGEGGAYTKGQADERFVKAATGLADLGALAKAGDRTAGPITLGGKPGAAKGTVKTGTVTFDYADGNVQSVTVDGAVTFAFANLPEIGGALQVNLTILSGSITIDGSTWWELGGGEKSQAFADTGVVPRTGRPYRLVVEMVAGFRTGIFQ